jgi:hypothetical protein
MTRQSIKTKTFCEAGWMRGSSSAKTRFALLPAHDDLALQLPFIEVSESMGNHDSKIVDAASVD